MYGIVHSVSFSRHRWAAVLTGLIYALAGALAGAGTGALLALIGATLPSTVFAVGGILLAMAGVGLGLAEAVGGHLRPWQCDRETPQRWAREGALRWAVRNGATLGVGMSSRIGFWLWYAVPLAALASREPLLGALIYGAYSLTRTGAALGLLALPLATRGRLDPTPHLLAYVRGARLLAATQLILVSLACGYAWWY